MKKMKKLMAALLAMVMMLAMTTTAFAEKAGATITVRGLSTAENQKVDIYEIYRLDKNDNGWERAEWVPKDVTPENLAEKVTELQSAEKDVVATQETTAGTVTFTETEDGEKLQAGAYLVLATDKSGRVEYSPMIAVTYKYGEEGLITVKDEEVVAKAETYTTGKEQADEDAVVEVGDLITYTIKTTVPYNDGTLESFTVTDELKGATYYLTGGPVKGVEAVNEVTVGGEATRIKISEENHGKTTFMIDMSELLGGNAYAGQEVVIKYTAKVEAVDSVTNKAISSNDPEGTTTTAYTGTATITKYDNDEKNPKTLEGAEFVLYRTVDGKTEYAIIKDEYVTGEWTEDINKATHVTTNDKGVATVKGLDVGIYWFKEVVAPDGYSINEEDVKVEITKTEANGQVTVGGATIMKDTKLASLPGTGGIGTTIFTIGGCIIMIAAAGFYFLSRKKENN